MRRKSEKVTKPKSPPALTLESRENQMIAKSVDLAEKRIEEGTASDTLILHYLKLGTTRMQLEKAKLEAEVELAKAKADLIREQDHADQLYMEAFKAFSIYSGEDENNEDIQ